MNLQLLCCIFIFSIFNFTSFLKVDARVTNLYFPKNSKSQTKIIDPKDQVVRLTLNDENGHQGILYDCRYKYYDSSESGKPPVIYCELPLKKNNKVYKLSIHLSTYSKSINRNSEIVSVTVAKDTDYKTIATNYLAKVSSIYDLKLRHKYKFNGRFNILTVDKTDRKKSADTSVLYDYFEIIEIYNNNSAYKY